MDDARSMDAPARVDLSRAADTAPVTRGGRLGVYAALGGLTGVVPLPWVPDALARRVRGALVYDIAARHGLSLTKEARDALAEPSGPEGPRGVVRQAATFVGKKLLARFTPIAFVAPARDALGTYVLGYLFDRYLDRARTEKAVRIDAEEARRVRRAIDRALVHALTSQPEAEERALPPEELRDGVTQLVDTLLGAAAGVPGFLVRRLDAAFDELLPAAR